MPTTGDRHPAATEHSLEQALAGWLPAQRWFAGKGRPITGLQITSDTELAAGGGDEPALRHLIVAVTQGTGTDRYQILVGLRASLPARLEHARIGVVPDGRSAYDALHDTELTRLLLRGIAEQQVIGPVRFARVTGAPLPANQRWAGSQTASSSAKDMFAMYPAHPDNTVTGTEGTAGHRPAPPGTATAHRG